MFNLGLGWKSTSPSINSFLQQEAYVILLISHLVGLEAMAKKSILALSSNQQSLY
jgi:hypothetical protein